MAFKTLFNVMPDDSASWGAFFQRQDCPRPLAQRLATRDPDIKSFFICRRDLKCQKGTFPAGTTVFVMTSPGTSANSACDSYQKDFFNVGYVNPDNMPLRYAGQVCVRSNTDRRPFFDIVCLFAVGIQGARDAARLEIGRGVAHTLDHTDDVAALQSLGIAVLLSVVGDWGPAGWSNFPTKESAYAFADKLGEVVARYGLDGIDIDDEYSDKRLVEGDSIIMVTSRLREQAKEKIIISKALYDDQLDFKWRWNGKTLAQQLSHGWDMSYGDDTGIARLRPYAESPPDADMRMQKHQLALGVRNCPEDPRNWTPPDSVARQTQEVKDNAYGGMMVFAAEDFVRAPDYESRISGVFYQGDVGNSTPGCRYLPTSILALAHSADEGNLHRLYISLASGGRVFGPPTPVKASGNDYHETTDVGTAMAVFKDLLWLAWIGPTAGGRDNYPNVCSAKVDPATQRLAFNKKVMFPALAKSVHAPAMAVFGERLYLAWTDLEGALQLMSCDGQSWTKPQVIKDKGVKGAPALGVVGDWLCAMVVDDDANHLFCLRSKDGLSFEAQEISNSRKKLLDVGAASHGGWLYVACIERSVGPPERDISMLRTQDGATFYPYGISPLDRGSRTWSDARLVNLGPYLYAVAKDGPSALASWLLFLEPAAPFGDRQMLPTIQSWAKPSLVGIDIWHDRTLPAG